jgi:hypothetical protein
LRIRFEYKINVKIDIFLGFSKKPPQKRYRTGNNYDNGGGIIRITGKHRQRGDKKELAPIADTITTKHGATRHEFAGNSCRVTENVKNTVDIPWT